MEKASLAETQITCPVCRSKHAPRRRGFTTNRAVLDIIEEIQKQKPVQPESDSVRCKKHGNKECVLVCMDCIEGLCVKCVKNSHHQGHRLEEPLRAKSLLQRKLGKYTKERKSLLEQQLSLMNKSPYSVTEITKAESDIRLFQEKLLKEITDWGDEQLLTLQNLKSEVVKQENELKKELKLLENQNVDLETMIKFGSSSISDHPRIVNFPVKSDKHKFEDSSTDPSSKIIRQEQMSGQKQTVDKSSQVDLDTMERNVSRKQIADNVTRRKGALGHKTATLEHQKSSIPSLQSEKDAPFWKICLVNIWNMLVRVAIFCFELFLLMFFFFVATEKSMIFVGLRRYHWIPSEKEKNQIGEFSFMLMMLSIITQLIGRQIMTLDVSDGGRVVNMIKYGCKFYLINAGLLSSVVLTSIGGYFDRTCLCFYDFGFIFIISLLSCSFDFIKYKGSISIRQNEL